MIQFSVWKEKWPKDAFRFLVRFNGKYRWYHLFEPNLLIRVAVDHDVEVVLKEAKTVAHSLDLRFQEGDLAKSSPSGENGRFYHGEPGFYGSEEFAACNTEWLFASSELLRQMEKEGKRNFKFVRKHIHLFCNQADMNYLQEAWFLLRCAFKSFYMFLRHGLQ